MSYKFTELKEGECFFLGTDVCKKTSSTTFVVQDEAFLGERMWDISMEPKIFTLTGYMELTYPNLAIGQQFEHNGVLCVKKSSIHFAPVVGPGMFTYNPTIDASIKKLAAEPEATKVVKKVVKKAVKKAVKAGKKK